MFPIYVLASDCESYFSIFKEEDIDVYNDDLYDGFMSHIPLCAKDGDCKPVLHFLDILKKVDNVRYNYIVGIAKANGDCFKQDFKSAESHLINCSSKSKTCRENRFRLYKNLNIDEHLIEPYALKLALEDFNLDALQFLASYYKKFENNQTKLKSIFFYTLLEKILNKKRWILHKKIEQTNKKGGEEYDLFIGDLKAKLFNFNNDYEVVGGWLLIAQFEIEGISYDKNKIDNDVESYLKKYLKHSHLYDPIIGISKIYNISEASIKSSQQNDKFSKWQNIISNDPFSTPDFKQRYDELIEMIHAAII